MDHEQRSTIGDEAIEPGDEQGQQRSLADSDGWVGPDLDEANVLRDLLGHHGAHIGQLASGGIERRELERSAIDVEGPDGGLRDTPGQGQCDRTVATTQIEQVSACSGRRSLQQQQLGAGVDAVPGEDSSVGGERQGQVGQREGNGMAP